MVEAPAREYQEVLSGRADVSLTSKVDAMKLINLYPELSIINIDDLKMPSYLQFYYQEVIKNG